MRVLVLLFGGGAQGRILTFIFLAILLVGAAGLAARLSPSSSGERRSPEQVITVATSVAEGCCTVTIRVVSGYDDKPIRGGTYEVETQAGRRPEKTSGDFSDGLIQVVVGRDWVGRIRVVTAGGKKVTDLIGGAYGMQERKLVI